MSEVLAWALLGSFFGSVVGCSVATWITVWSHSRAVEKVIRDGR